MTPVTAQRRDGLLCGVRWGFDSAVCERGFVFVRVDRAAGAGMFELASDGSSVIG